MTDMPERIWISPADKHISLADNRYHPVFANDVEYTRADLVPTWQPIETAPKDGTKIILRRNDLVVAPCEWLSDGVFVDNPLWVWWAPEHRVDMETDEGPTHWMPLPQAPSEAI